MDTMVHGGNGNCSSGSDCSHLALLTNDISSDATGGGEPVGDSDHETDRTRSL